MRPSYGATAPLDGGSRQGSEDACDDGYGTTQSIIDGELDGERGGLDALEAQAAENSSSAQRKAASAPSSSSSSSASAPKLSNRAVVTFGSVGLLFLTFGTFFLVINNRSGESSGSWSSSSTGVIFSSPGSNDESSVQVSLADDSNDDGSHSVLQYSISRSNYDVLEFFNGESQSEQLQYKILKDHVGVLEPYAPMELTMIKDHSARSTRSRRGLKSSSSKKSSRRGGSTKQVVKYEYTITDPSGDVAAGPLVSYAEESDSDVSDTFTIGCSPGDVYTITVSRYSGDEETYSESATLLCKYVRREFRTLTSDDLSTVMDAMYTLWEYDTKKGQKKFGDDYYDADFFAETHFYNAGFRDSDHIHEGLGFMAQHIKMTNLFEKAMQAVDPSVSLFYWDFTIDTKEGLTVFTTPYYSADTFGSIPSPSNSTMGWSYQYDSLEDAKIPDGRWAGLKAQKNTEYPELTQAYGYIRAPWNMNPSEYISRFSLGPPHVNLPGCGNYKEWFEDKDFAASMKEAAYGPHSTVHTAVGGVYGCDSLDEMREMGLILDSSLSNQQSICLKWGFFVKEYFRGNYLTPNTDCSEDSDSCFTCNSDSLDDMLSMMQSSALKNYVPEDLDDEGWQKWQDFVCKGKAHKIFVGDHLESASPADPSFWPIHPTQERLLQARYANGGFWDFEWPTMASAGDYVCNHFQCYDDETLELKTDDVSCCYGHYEYDELYYPGDRTKTFGGTTRATLDALDASSADYSMPYIYDSFKWDHCEDLFDVESIADVLALKALTLDSTGNPVETTNSESLLDSSTSSSASTTSPDSNGYSTVLSSSSRQSSGRGGAVAGAARGDSEEAAGADTDTGVTAASNTVTSTDSKGYSTVLASDSRWTGRAKGWGDVDDDRVPEHRH